MFCVNLKTLKIHCCKSRSNNRTWKRFTLIELLIVVAIIGILIAMLLPSLASARRTAYRAACASNQKQLAVAIMQFAVAHERHLPAAQINAYTWDDFLGVDGHDGRTLSKVEAKRLTGVRDASMVSKLYYCPANKLPFNSDGGGFLRTYGINTGGDVKQNITKDHVYAGVAGINWSCRLSEISAPTDTMLLGSRPQWFVQIGSRWGAQVRMKVAVDSANTDQSTGLHGSSFRDNYLFNDGHVECIKFAETQSPNIWTRASDD